MRTPKGRDSKMSALLDKHLEFDITPSWYVMNFLNIKESFFEFLNRHLEEPTLVKDLYGRSLPYADHPKVKGIMSYEPRDSYHKAAKTIASKEIERLSTDNLMPNCDSMLLINLEFGSLGKSEIPLDFNESFRKEHTIFGYRYKQPRNKHKPFPLEGKVVDTMNEIAWEKRITSHLHEGKKKEQFHFVTFYNLAPNY